jgi:hypothetical protein
MISSFPSIYFESCRSGMAYSWTITIWPSYRAVISRARGEKRKIALQIILNRLMQRYVSTDLHLYKTRLLIRVDTYQQTIHSAHRMNDRLCELDVPPSSQGAIYSQLSARNVSFQEAKQEAEHFVLWRTGLVKTCLTSTMPSREQPFRKRSSRCLSLTWSIYGI